MSIPSKKIALKIFGAGAGSLTLYGLHKSYSKRKEVEGDIFIGQYSIVHQLRELSRLDLIKPSSTVYVIEHFTQRTHKEIMEIARWGQKPCGTSLSMEYSSAIKDIDKEKYLTIGDVVRIKNEAIEELRKKRFTVVEVDDINNIKKGIHGSIYVNYTKDGKLKNGIHKEDSIVFNSAVIPRVNRNRGFTVFPNTEVLFRRGIVKNDCPKLVFGGGPSAVWAKEHCQDVRVVFGSNGAVEQIRKFAKNPRNTQIIGLIKDTDQVDLTSHIIRTGVDIERLDGSSEWHKQLKIELQEFLERYKHLELRSEHVALIINEKTYRSSFIGEGINAIGYDPNNKIIEMLPPQNVISLHIKPTEMTEDCVAPQEILGSVIHNLDYQRIVLADFYENRRGEPWSLENRMLLLPFERLLLRVKAVPPLKTHREIITSYMDQNARLNVNPIFFEKLGKTIREINACPRSPQESVEIMVRDFCTIDPRPSAEDISKFKETLLNLINLKQQKLTKVNEIVPIEKARVKLQKS